MAGYPRSVPYGPDAGEHLIDVQPAHDLTPCTWYDVTVSAATPLADGTGQPVTPYTWGFRTDDGAGAACPASTSPLTGRVTGPDGAPLAGAAVLAFAPGDVWWPSALTTTRTDGTYVLTDLEHGSYRLLFRPPAGTDLAPEWSGDAADRGHAADVSVPSGSGADAELSAAASISGVGRDPGGEALAEVEGLAYGANDTWVPSTSTTTAADGSYSFAGLPGGSYRLSFRPPAASGLPVQWFDGSATRAGATPVVATPGAPVVADHQFVGSASVSGVVTGPGGPVAGARVTFFGPGDLWVGSIEAVTDASGAYTIDAAPPATYQVRFTPPAASGLATQWFGGVAVRRLSTPVVLTAGATTEVSATFATG
jgi:hypothetical protein